MTSYVYSIANDVNQGILNSNNLTKEINDSLITSKLVGMSTIDDELTILFYTSLTAGEEIILQQILSNHNSDVVTEPTKLFITQEYVPTGGNAVFEALYINGDPLLPEDAPQTEKQTVRDFQWDYPISVMLIRLRTQEENVGDATELYITLPDKGYGESVISQLVDNVNTGATTCNLPANVVSNLYVGDYLYLKDPTNEDELGFIKDVNRISNIITFSIPTVRSFDKLNTLVKFRRYIAKHFELGPPNLYSFGESKITGSHLDKQMIARVIYKNRGNTAKKLYVILEYLR